MLTYRSSILLSVALWMFHTSSSVYPAQRTGRQAPLSPQISPLSSLSPSLSSLSSSPPASPSASPSTPRRFEIPVTLPHYHGKDSPIDDCPRNQVKLADGRCYQLLTQGPCSTTHFVLLNPTTNLGYCGPRLCAPDRIFIFSDQLCHDPADGQLCPKGRQLYQTSLGTPVCQCPEGTYETNDDDDDQEDRGCEPMLASATSCAPGQVLWFRDFSSPRECLPDPCGGKNIRRSLEEHLLIPSAVDGNCYPLGQSGGVCPPGTLFSLALNKLQGICSKLEDAGYLVLDQSQLMDLEEFYGPFIPKDSAEPSELLNNITENSPTTSSNNLSSEQEIFLAKEHVNPTALFPAEPTVSVTRSPYIQQPLRKNKGIYKPLQKYSIPQKTVYTPLDDYSDFGLHLRNPSIELQFRNPSIQLFSGQLLMETRVQGSFDRVFSSKTSRDISVPIAQRVRATDEQFADVITQLLSIMSLPSHWKRTSEKRNHLDSQAWHRRRLGHRVSREIALPHFSPGNIFNTRLVTCRSGAKRDVNAKCRDLVLPSRSPKKQPLPVVPEDPLMIPPDAKDTSRMLRSAPPVEPKPHCPTGAVYNMIRQCEVSGTVNFIIPQNLG